MALPALALLVPLFLALDLVGCVRHVHWPYDGVSDHRVVDDRPNTDVRRLPAAGTLSVHPPGRHPDMQWQPLPAGELDYGWHERYLISKARPCIARGESPVQVPSAKVMLSRRPGPKRWVVLLPIWGSSIYPPRQMARRLLRGPHGPDTNVLWILGPDELFDWQAMATAPDTAAYVDALERGARCLASSVRDVQEYLDWIAARDDYDPDRLGLVGFSIGAIAASLVLAEDPRPDATALVMGGARLEHVLASCRGDARSGRDGALVGLGWSRDEFLSRVADAMAPVEPVARLRARGGPAVDPASIFFVDATRDGCIPEISREQLWRALGEPERLSVPYGHKMSFLSMTFLGLHHTSHRILDFLDRRLRGAVRSPAGGDLATASSPERPP